MAQYIGVNNKNMNLRSSDTDTSLHPSADHARRKIEPSCPVSLHIFMASYC